MDSVTRFAMAQREIGLAIGEPPATRGYTPSVFAMLPRLLERSGCGEKGSITALYTVLVEGDDMNEPVADSVRGILDGHLVLSRALAHANHYPAIDVLESVSRLARDICAPRELEIAAAVRDQFALYKRNEDLITIGAYQKGANPLLDQAIAQRSALQAFLRQDIDDATSRTEAFSRLHQITAA
jgi:flagellum-specific ATP synthase